ncbi:hypothetical protein GEV33_003191 [Tenebrio molitor]|uniref:DUF4371 domain-containing protein n=1 Tax=Tenebrio molitor TaxID=7067 RepID=A0A8J6HRT4_TENMO|nr:hypothetical protein GEV33_003191 [Tenebrio molitor]
MAIETSATQQSRRPRHNPENNNAIDNGRENLHSIIVIIEITTSIEKPQCVLCNAVLSAESMKPSKLKRHLETKHSEHVTKDLDFFKRCETRLKHQKLDATGNFQQQRQTVVQASYEIALQVAKNKKPHTIAETLIKPCLLKSVKLILGEASEMKMRHVSLSNNTIQRRILDMSADVLEQILSEIRASPVFSFQLDESTDVSSCSQLLVFVKYIHLEDIKEEFLFCRALKTSTKSEDVMVMIRSFFETKELQWENLCGVCTDGAPAMLGSRSGFQKKVKDLAPQAKGSHCMIHRFALATKTLPKLLQEVLDSLIKIVNYIKSSALNTRLFKEFCKDMNSDHEALLFYTAVRWLSKGNVVERVFELKDELKSFLEMQRKQEFLINFNDEAWIQRVAYLSDIFGQLNKLNLKLQGKDMHIIHFRDNLQTFVSKLGNWRRKANLGNFAMFEHLCTTAEASEAGIVENLKEEIGDHLQFLETEMQRYFPELSEDEAAVVRNPFHASLDVADVPDEVQDEFLELRNDSTARDLFQEKTLTEFWCAMRRSRRLESTDELYLAPEASSTADLLLFFDRLFDSVNGSASSGQPGKELRGLVTETSDHLTVWRDSLPVLQSMFYSSDKGKLITPSIKNWAHNIRACIYLRSKLFSLVFKRFARRNFNQDPIENFFSCIRGHGFLADQLGLTVKKTNLKVFFVIYELSLPNKEVSNLFLLQFSLQFFQQLLLLLEVFFSPTISTNRLHLSDEDYWASNFSGDDDAEDDPPLVTSSSSSRTSSSLSLAVDSEPGTSCMALRKRVLLNVMPPSQSSSEDETCHDDSDPDPEFDLNRVNGAPNQLARLFSSLLTLLRINRKKQ